MFNNVHKLSALYLQFFYGSGTGGTRSVKHDLIGGLRNGLDVAAVGYGFGSHEELQAESPTYHFATLAELHAAFLKTCTNFP